MDDDSLTRHLAANLDATFEALVMAHQDRLYTIALRVIGEPRDAEEVTQDAFVRAYRALSAWDADRIRSLRLRPWLASIVVNLSRNRRRRAADRRPPASLAPPLGAGLEPASDPAQGPEGTRLRREAAERWAVRLLRCPPALRIAVVLRHVDGLSYVEIAAVLGRPVGTVKAQVHRGLVRLRQDLEQEALLEREELSA
jgi:RNA polymerase sigma-70 factor (ECF subfamily)